MKFTQQYITKHFFSINSHILNRYKHFKDELLIIYFTLNA